MSEDIRLIAEQARNEYRSGQITREEAQAKIQPYLDAVNAKAIELAKKYNQKPKKAFFGSYVR